MSAARKSLKKPYVAAAESSAPVAVTQDSGVADSGAEANQMEKIEEKSSKAKTSNTTRYRNKKIRKPNNICIVMVCVLCRFSCYASATISSCDARAPSKTTENQTKKKT